MVLEQPQPHHGYSGMLLWKPRLINTQVSYCLLVRAASILISAEVLYFGMPYLHIIFRSRLSYLTLSSVPSFPFCQRPLLKGESGIEKLQNDNDGKL